MLTEGQCQHDRSGQRCGGSFRPDSGVSGRRGSADLKLRQMVDGIVAAAQNDPDLLNNPYFKALYDQAAANRPSQIAASQAGGKAVGDGLGIPCLPEGSKKAGSPWPDSQQGFQPSLPEPKAQTGSQDLAAAAAA